MRNLRVAIFLSVLVVLAGGHAFAQGQAAERYDKALSKGGQPTDRLPVIVRYKSGTSSRLQKRIAGHVERIKRDHKGINGLVVELRRGKLHQVCDGPEVDGCSLDAIVDVGAQLLLIDDTQDPSTTSTTSTDSTTTSTSPESTTTTTSSESSTTDSSYATATDSSSTSSSSSYGQYDGQNLRATLGLTSEYRGAGVGVAIIDSGIAQNWDLAGRIAAFYDFTKGGVASSPIDAYGHGTHIAGLIAGNGTISNGKYVGVAPAVRLIGLRVLDANGQGYTSDVIAALEFAVTNRVQLGARCGPKPRPTGPTMKSRCSAPADRPGTTAA